MSAVGGILAPRWPCGTRDGAFIEVNPPLAAIRGRAEDDWLSAEGVETEGERDTVLALGAVRGRGYLFGGPTVPD